MGLMDVVSNVVTRYHADTKDHVAELKKLKGEERERAKQAIADNEKLSNTLDDQVKGLAKLGIAIGSIAVAYAGARSAISAYAEHTKNAAAAGNADIDRLKEATKGLKTETELLADAARMKTSAFKLNTEQMVIAEQAMLQFTRRGVDNAKAHEAVLQAVTALKLDGLKDLGVFIDTTGLKMDNESDRGKILQRVLQGLTEASNEFAKSQLSAAEQVQKMGVTTEDAIDRLKTNAGKGLNAVVGGIEALGKAAAKYLGGPKGEDTLAFHITNNVIPHLTAMAEISRIISITDPYERLKAVEAYRTSVGLGKDAKIDYALYGGRYTVTRDEKQTGTTTPPPTAKFDADAYYKAMMADLQKRMRTEAVDVSVYGISLGPAGGLGSKAATSGGDIFGDDITKRFRLEAQRREWAANAAREAEEKDPRKRFWGGYDLVSEKDREKRADSKSFMERTFGPVGQFDVYAAAWQGFTGAVTAGYSAMVDGTMGFGKAFKLAIAGALKATGAQMLIESLKEAAYGVAALAKGPLGVAAATAHFKSSAMFAAGAVAAGVAANALGGGGAAAGVGSGAGAAATAPRNPGTEAPAQSSIVYVVGDPFDTETNPRRRQQNAKRLLRQTGYSPTPGGDY